MPRENKVYHILPSPLVGEELHPLSRLEILLPELALHAQQKYAGRELLPLKEVPPLACRWKDTVMFVPVHPEEVRDALLQAGHPRFPSQWLEVDAEPFAPERAVIYLPGSCPAEESFAPFNLAALAAHRKLPSLQRKAYAECIPGKVLLFGLTAHVLHRGSVSLKGSRVVNV